MQATVKKINSISAKTSTAVDLKSLFKGFFFQDDSLGSNHPLRLHKHSEKIPVVYY